MRRIICIVATLAIAALSSSGAHAQPAKAYVSSSGTDTGLCPQSAPCATFPFATNVMSAGGFLTCLSSGAFASSGLVISKALTIDCVGTDSSTASITITTAASDRVTLRGLAIQANSDLNSIDFTGAGTLVLNQVRAGAGTSGDGASALRFRPNGNGKLVVTDSVFSTSGVSTGGGIVVRPQAGGTAQVALSRVAVSGNAFGIAVDGTDSTGGINATIIDSVMASNANDGLVATSLPATAPIGVTVVKSASINNAFGIRSFGSNVTVRVRDSDITGNGTGLSGSGALLSGGGNTVQANGINGGFTGSYPLQ